MTVVALLGEHDITTIAYVSALVARAIADQRAEVVVDLSEVTYLGAATVRVLARARTLLKGESRTLVVRAPSRAARRILQLCDLGLATDGRPDTPLARPADKHEVRRSG